MNHLYIGFWLINNMGQRMDNKIIITKSLRSTICRSCASDLMCICTRVVLAKYQNSKMLSCFSRCKSNIKTKAGANQGSQDLLVHFLFIRASCLSHQIRAAVCQAEYPASSTAQHLMLWRKAETFVTHRQLCNAYIWGIPSLPLRHIACALRHRI